MSGTEKLKLWAAAILVIGVIYVAAYAELPVAGRFGVSAIGLIAAGGLIFFSQSGRDFSRFVRDAGVELRKVVWPTKQETLQLTGIVFILLSIATVFLWVVDLVIGYLLDILVG